MNVNKEYQHGIVYAELLTTTDEAAEPLLAHVCNLLKKKLKLTLCAPRIAQSNLPSDVATITVTISRC